MEAPEGSSRIRPLPPERPAEAPDPEAGRPPSRRLPLVIAGLAMVVVVALAGVFGSSNGGDDAAAGAEASSSSTTTVPEIASGDPSITTTTTVPPPPTLEELVPEVGSVLAMVWRGPDFGGLMLWAANEQNPRFSTLTARPERAAFDAGGAWLAYLASYGAGDVLHVGLRTATQAPQFLDAASFAWHGTDAGRLGWTGRVPFTDSFGLYEAEVDETTGRLIGIRQIADLLPGDRLVAWDYWGYAVEHAPLDGPFEYSRLESPEVSFAFRLLTIYDATGTPQVTAPGRLLGWSADGTLLVDPGIGYGLDLAASGVTPAAAGFRGTAVVGAVDAPYLTDAGLWPIQTPDGLATGGTLLLLPDGTRVTSVRPTAGNRSSVTTIDVAGRGTRIASVEGAIQVIGLSPDGRFVVLQRVGEEGDTYGAVLLVDWRTGVEYELPFDPGLEVVAFRVD